jgi:hypothetical protein
MFHDLEGSNRWITFLNHVDTNGNPPEMYASLGNTIIAFINGQVFKLFRDTENYSKFFGVQYEEEIDVYGNEGQGQVQVYDAIGLLTNNDNPMDDTNAWYVKEMTTKPSATNPNGMLTKIYNRDFKMKEGVLWAAIPKDINTPMAGSVNMKRLNGQPMRGDSCLIKLANKSKNSVILNAVYIKTTLSDKLINSDK